MILQHISQVSMQKDLKSNNAYTYIAQSQINSRKKYRLESNDTTKRFHWKTVRQEKSSTDNHHVRKQVI